VKVFVTVGTIYGFDRLTRAVDAACEEGILAPADIFAQIGNGRYLPRHYPYADFLERPAYEERIRDSDLIVGHAGMGTICAGLRFGKKMVVLPRRKRYREVVNDHQENIGMVFEKAGHLLFASDEVDLLRRLREVPAFEPVPRKTQEEAVAGAIRSAILSFAGHGAFPPRSPRGDDALPPRSPRGDDAFPPRSPRGDDAFPPRSPRGDGGFPPRSPRGDGGFPGAPDGSGEAS
jgi:UDP-N-acetylglucosamine transferase subunit ALG13